MELKRSVRLANIDGFPEIIKTIEYKFYIKNIFIVLFIENDSHLGYS
jgi:hypothetical protein